MIASKNPDLTAADPGTIGTSNSSPRLVTFYIPGEHTTESFFYRLSKRIMDVFVALFALAVGWPVMAIVSLVIWLEDRGPIVFVQRRVGRYGVPIPFYKFRSMWVDAEKHRDALFAQSDAKGIAFKMKDDPRITKTGKFIRKYSLDELPQLFCVLSGYMSIVGPRPLPLKEGYACSEEQRARYLVKPGLICLREIGGRSNLSFEQWMTLDLDYVSRRSLLLDISILLRLIPAVIRAEGAY